MLLGYFFVIVLQAGTLAIGPFADRDLCWAWQQGAEALGFDTERCEVLDTSNEATPPERLLWLARRGS